jgi:hypothetical protein
MEVIDIVAPRPPAGTQWNPVVGSETLDLLDHLSLSEKSRDVLRDEALNILGRCLPPTTDAGHQTGLAVGYVQSGKTMSFTTLAALARDNGYGLVIVVAGATSPLLDQSRRRLESDLRLNNRYDRCWLHLESESIVKTSVRDNFSRTLADWRDGAVSHAERRTILLTTMKNHRHLGKVTKTLKSLNLSGIAALVIDDEADQASLNTLVLKSDESTTYRRIKELREALPHHSYVQYTATPQAPLLINIIDTLSPNFVEVLTPGQDYVGGKHFIIEHPELIRTIPEDTSPDTAPTDPPDSLLEALRLFMVGVAAGLAKNQGKGNRSMMIHPSQRRAGHSEYYRWVHQIQAHWRRILDAEEEDADRLELMAEFEAAYADLQGTEPEIPPFTDIHKRLPKAVGKTMIEEINSAAGRTPSIRWRDHYSWILVGGQAMDRGFTVEGLTVTYMPRGVGIGNADTVQQRARFFGYKRSYAGYCRVFLGPATREAFRRYVEHEEDVHRRLAHHAVSGAPLADWKRMFFLDGALKPTRQSVIDIAYHRTVRDATWYQTRQPHVSQEAIEANRQVRDDFLARLKLEEDPGSDLRSAYQRHARALEVPLRVVMEDLLTKLHFAHSADSAEFTLLQILLSERIDGNPEETCAVYVMSGGTARERTTSKQGDILNLFQGAAPSKPAGEAKVGDIYRGDRSLAFQHACPVLQIHKLNVEGPAGLSAKDVPAFAMHIPADGSADMLIQPQGAYAL